jgi:hypothetical protein
MFKTRPAGLMLLANLAMFEYRGFLARQRDVLHLCRTKFGNFLDLYASRLDRPLHMLAVQINELHRQLLVEVGSHHFVFSCSELMVQRENCWLSGLEYKGAPGDPR